VTYLLLWLTGISHWPAVEALQWYNLLFSWCHTTVTAGNNTYEPIQNILLVFHQIWPLLGACAVVQGTFLITLIESSLMFPDGISGHKGG